MSQNQFPDVSMHELFVDADRYVTDHSEERLGMRLVETPGGMLIVKDGNMLRVEATFEKSVGGKICDSTVRVEFRLDSATDPKVYEDWAQEDGAGTSTVRTTMHPEYAADLIALINPDWADERTT